MRYWVDIAGISRELDLVKGASHAFDKEDFLQGKLTPVFFGSAINNFGVREFLDAFAICARTPTYAKPKHVQLYQKKKNFQDLFLKFKLIWILHIGIASPFYECARENIHKA